MFEHVPPWLQEWFSLVLPASRVLLVVVVAILLQGFIRRVIDRIGTRHGFPASLTSSARRISGFLIYSAALLLSLQLLGVDGQVLWAALTGFVAVAAIAFFAAWSVLSNIFCALLIFTTRPFRSGDDIELLENGEKPGLRGRVRDIGMVYTTLVETHPTLTGTVLRVPNSLFFQRTIRRHPRSGDPDRGSQPDT